MHNPNIWSKMRVPVNWQELPSEVALWDFLQLLEGRDNQEVQLMIDFDNKIWWRRDLTEYRELGL